MHATATIPSTPMAQNQRSKLTRRIRTICTSPAFTALLHPWGGGGPREPGGLMVADALQQALGAGELRGVMGYPLAPRGAPVSWQHALVQLGPDVFADGDGIAAERTLRRRWLRQEGTIIVRIDPMPPREEWPRAYPDTPYDPAAVARLIKLLQAVLP